MECSGRGGGPALLWTFRLHTNRFTAHQPIYCTPTNWLHTNRLTAHQRNWPNFDLLHTLLDCCTPSWIAAHPPGLLHTLQSSKLTGYLLVGYKLTAHPPDFLHTLQTDCTPSTLTAHPPDLLHTLHPRPAAHPPSCCTPSVLLHTLRPAAHPPKSHKSAGPPPLTLHSILGISKQVKWCLNCLFRGT